MKTPIFQLVSLLGFALGACSPLAQTMEVSQCGGFSQLGSAITDEASAYCAAEVLDWRYVADTETLHLSNDRILLNCCGEHSITVHQEGELYVVTERDAPEQIGPLPLPGSGARCDCMCVFDFSVQVQSIAADPIELKIVREVTDSDLPVAEIWRGTIDLALGQGTVTIDDEDVGPWCGGLED